MRYRLKDLSADAIQIPPGSGKILVNGEPVPTNGYIVVMRDRLWVFTREEFQDEFEADGPGFHVKDIAGNGAEPKARKPPEKRKPVEITPEVDPEPQPERKAERKGAGPTLAEIIGPLLHKQSMTLDALTEAVKREVPTTSRASIYSTLYTNKARFGWIFDKDRAVWRYPAGKGISA
jgi:hypothetical protein